MNSANAVGFFALGVVMWMLPLLAPGWFPHSAVDGSSARALWLQVMGVVQVALATWYWARHYVMNRLARSASSTSASEPAGTAYDEAEFHAAVLAPRGHAAADIPEPVLPVGSVMLHGEHAALWRAFNDAMRADGHVRQLASRLFSMVEATREGENAAPVNDPAESEKVVAFAWADERREMAEEQVA